MGQTPAYYLTQEHICFLLASPQESDVESTLPHEEWPLSLSTVERTKERQRVNLRQPVQTANILGHLLKTVITDTFRCHRKQLPPA